MSRWDEARTTTARREAIAGAIREAGTVSGAAQALGISRQHLHRFMHDLADVPADPPTPTAVPEEPSVRIVVDLPKHQVDWLEWEALRRKQERGQSRMAKAPIVAELIEQAIRRQGEE